MKRLHIIWFAVGSLLLAGCELPENLDELVGWRESFFNHATSQQIVSWFGIIIGLLALLLLGSGLNYAIKAMNSKGDFIQVALFIILNSVGVMMIILFPQFISDFLDRIIPQDWLLDQVFALIGVELDPSISGAINLVWKVGMTISVPSLIVYGAFVLTIIAFPAMAIGIIKRSNHGIVFLVTAAVGVIMFTSMWIGFVKFYSENYPSWDFGPTDTVMSLIYTGVTIILYVVCFYALPIAAVILLPDKKEEAPVEIDTQSPTTEPEKKPFNWSWLDTVLGLLAGLSFKSEPPQEVRQPPSYSTQPQLPPGEPKDGIDDGSWYDPDDPFATRPTKSPSGGFGGTSYGESSQDPVSEPEEQIPSTADPDSHANEIRWERQNWDNYHSGEPPTESVKPGTQSTVPMKRLADAGATAANIAGHPEVGTVIRIGGNIVESASKKTSKPPPESPEPPMAKGDPIT
jgi:hypothetical protein